jgi:hypothetical protein
VLVFLWLLILLSVMSSRSIHFAATDRISFLFIFHHVSILYSLICSPANEHLVWVYILATVNSVTITLDLPVSFCYAYFVFIGFVPRNGIAEQYSGLFFEWVLIAAPITAQKWELVVLSCSKWLLLWGDETQRTGPKVRTRTFKNKGIAWEVKSSPYWSLIVCSQPYQSRYCVHIIIFITIGGSNTTIDIQFYQVFRAMELENNPRSNLFIKKRQCFVYSLFTDTPHIFVYEVVSWFDSRL